MMKTENKNESFLQRDSVEHEEYAEGIVPSVKKWKKETVQTC